MTKLTKEFCVLKHDENFGKITNKEFQTKASDDGSVESHFVFVNYMKNQKLMRMLFIHFNKVNRFVCYSKCFSIYSNFRLWYITTFMGIITNFAQCIREYKLKGIINSIIPSILLLEKKEVAKIECQKVES